jgi:hypothetical protein
MHVKKGDKVKVISGGDKGKVSEIVEARAARARTPPSYPRVHAHAPPPRHAAPRLPLLRAARPAAACFRLRPTALWLTRLHRSHPRAHPVASRRF